MPEINWKSQGIFSFLAQKETAGCLILHFSEQRQKNWDSEGGFTAFSAFASDFSLIHGCTGKVRKVQVLLKLLRSSSSFRFFLSSISRLFILNAWIRTSYLSPFQIEFRRISQALRAFSACNFACRSFFSAGLASKYFVFVLWYAFFLIRAIISLVCVLLVQV